MKCKCASSLDEPVSMRVKGAFFVFKMVCSECKQSYVKKIKRSSTDKIEEMKERMK